MITENIVITLAKLREECKKKNINNATFEIWLNLTAYDEIMADPTQYFPPVQKELKEKSRIYGMDAYLLLDRLHESEAKFIIKRVGSIDPVSAETPELP